MKLNDLRKFLGGGKTLKALCAAMLLGMTLMTNAQNIVTIGNGEIGSYSLPIDMYYNYSITEQIYDPGEIGTSGTITSIAFYYDHTVGFGTSGISIFMKNVTRSVFADDTDMEPLSESDCVWTGNIIAEGPGWITINLETPFYYDGTSHLLVACYDGIEGYFGNDFKFRCSNTQDNKMLSWFSDTNIPNPLDLGNGSGFNKYYYTIRNNIRLGIIPDGGIAITEVYVNGYESPVGGQNPQDHLNLTVPEGANYHIDFDDSTWLDEYSAWVSHPFEAGSPYWLWVTLRANDGYYFDNNCVSYVNNDQSLVDYFSIDDDNTIANMYTVEEVATEPLVNLSYDFDDGSMQGWTNIDADGDGHVWKVFLSGVQGHNGSSHCISSESYSFSLGIPLTPDNYMVSPIKAQYGNISFYASAQDQDYPEEHFGVAVSTDSNTNAADFVTVAEWTMTAKHGAWYEYTVDFGAYAGQDIWVAIRHFNCTDYFYLDVDDITLSIGNDGIKENNFAGNLSLYPNPVSDKLMVESEAVVSRYEVYDILGEMVANGEVNTEVFELNVNELPAGVYLIRTNAEGTVRTKRFVKR